MQITTSTLFIIALAALIIAKVHNHRLQAKLRKERRIKHRLLLLTVGLMKAAKELVDIHNGGSEGMIQLNIKPDKIEIITKKR